MSNNIENIPCIDKSSATDIQILAIKHAEIHALGMGYTGAGNRPDSTARIEITGTPDTGSVARFVIIFYPVGDTRLINPFYNADRSTLTVTQTLAALPAWISALTAIPSNETGAIAYYATTERYEFECLRTLTNK